MVRVALAFAVGVVGISFAAIFVRFALPAPPVVSAFYRTLFASMLLALGLAAAGLLGAGGRTRGPALPGPSALLALAAGLCFGTDLALWHTALVRTSVANATLLVNTTPVYVGLFAWVVLRDPPGRRFVAGAAIAMAGTALLLRSHPGDAGALRGDLLALAGAGFYSGYLLLMKAARRSGDAIPALLAATIGATAVLALYARLGDDPLRGFPPHSWAAMAAAAVVSQIVGVFGIVWALRYARATFASVALLAQPVGTAALGWWLLDEPLGTLQALGAAGVLAGIFLASGSASDPQAARRPPAIG